MASRTSMRSGTGPLSATVARPAMSHHSVVSAPKTNVAHDTPYVKPPGLGADQQHVYEECSGFLGPEKLNYLKAHLLKQVGGWHDFTSAEIQKTRAVAKKHNVEL